jgi:hypothetical protein
MTPHFQSYVSNLSRARIADIVDQQMTLLRHRQARLSLVVNPLSGLPYPAKTQDSHE